MLTTKPTTLSINRQKLPVPTREQINAWLREHRLLQTEYVGKKRAYESGVFKRGEGSTNLERLQRIVALDILRHEDPDRFLKTIKANKSPAPSLRGNELWVSDGRCWLRYADPSTHEIYVSGVPNRDDADNAMAWKFRLSKEEYLSIEKET